jgi:hypothetical protein
MSTDKFPQSNGSELVKYLKDTYGNEIRKSVFDSVGCSSFYDRLLRKGSIVMICDGPDPLVKIEKIHQESDIYI